MRKTSIVAMMLATGSAALAAAPAKAPTAAEIIAARQAAFKMSAVAFLSIKGAIDRGAEPKTMGFAASGLTDWSHAVPAMFPKGSDGAPTKALPAVWSDRAGFDKAAAAYASASDALLAAVKSGDAAAVKTAFGGVGGACKACHDSYRQPEGAH